MSPEHFHKAIALAAEYEQHVTIGGGEPTLHPHCKEFMQHAQWELAHVSESSGCPAVCCITNGTNTKLALQMAKLASMGIISARVSKDQYHDASMVDPRVYEAFEPHRNSITGRPDADDCRGINDGEGFIQPVGRAKSWGHHPLRTCFCDSVFITPKGDVWPCACKVKKIGHLDDASLPLVYEHFEGHCGKSKQYKEAVEPIMRGEKVPA